MDKTKTGGVKTMNKRKRKKTQSLSEKNFNLGKTHGSITSSFHIFRLFPSQRFWPQGKHDNHHPEYNE